MSNANEPPSFRFDLTRADRALWSHGGKKGEFAGCCTATGFFIDDTQIADEFSCRPPAAMADLVDIAMAIHTADRLAVRTIELRNNWSRRLEIKVGVRCLDLWIRAAARIEQLLCFLTEDAWHLSFVPSRISPRSSEIQEYLFSRGPDSSDAEVSLFSDGLGSFAGTADRAFDSSTQLVLVSASPNPRHRKCQQRQTTILRERLRGEISHVCIPYGIHHGDEYAQEPSRRTRGFIFLILGGVTALLAGTSDLYLYENGIGAVNLPYDQSQLGTDNARAVRPRVLREVGEIVSLAGNKRFCITNRSFYRTKAEMLRTPAIDKVKRAILTLFRVTDFLSEHRGVPSAGTALLACSEGIP